MRYSQNSPTIKLIDLAGILGGIVMTYFGVGYLMDKYPLRLFPLTPGSMPTLPEANQPSVPGPDVAPGQPAPVQRLMTESPLQLVSGRRYGVALSTPALASNSDVRSAAKDLGFTNIDVYSKPPPGWPGNKSKSKADTWVVAFYPGASKGMPRADSGVEVIEAWEG